ncbi:choloylglycine hydrolase family protein [candidate division WOR-3 bacterium]|nr:choloylglycine hydrolase family protein [candidate division WOR-3 bacterium]
MIITLICGRINPAYACTGIRLIAMDESVVYGRTMEWGKFDLQSRVIIVPRGYSFTGLTPEGFNGREWQAKYGYVGLDMMGRDYLADGMNERGLAVGLFYHAGFAEYPIFEKDLAGITITAIDLTNYILSQFATTDEVRSGINEVRVVSVTEEAIGMSVYAHWMVTDASGKSIVIEFSEGEARIFENPLGVITNGPTYDWHMTNLRNYVNLSPVALPDKSIEGIDFAPLGGGSGMIGLPGDNTPPSRFVRAVAWSQTSRSTDNSAETVYELFRILDNFNIPLGASEGSDGSLGKEGMRSSTIWTTAWDLSERVLYYHTQHNRRVRVLYLNELDFSELGNDIIHLPLDQDKKQDTEDITPRF